MTGKTELLPCPFCGGEAEVTCAGRGKYQAQARCTQCHCELGAWYISKRAAAHAWNTRAERTCEVVASYDTADVDSRGSNAEWYFAFSCGCELYWDEPEPPNYCPTCGARIRKVVKR